MYVIRSKSISYLVPIRQALLTLRPDRPVEENPSFLFSYFSVPSCKTVPISVWLVELAYNQRWSLTEPSNLNFQEKDAYGNEVGVSARRVPVAYLLVDVPCGVANEGRAPTLSPPALATAFPPAHRLLQDHMQTLQALHHHIESAETFLDVSRISIYDENVCPEIESASKTSCLSNPA